MAVYGSPEAFYTTMRNLFGCVEASYPEALAAIASAKLIIRLNLREPQAEIVINGRQRPVVTSFGGDGVKPDLSIDMTADSFHHVLLGDVALQKAFSSGQMRVKGNIFKAATLGDLITVTKRCYPEIYRDQQGMP